MDELVDLSVLNEHITQVFVAEHLLMGGWSMEAPYILRCPVCQGDYVAPGKPIELSGEDNYKAWAGRGDCLRIPFHGECGHRFALCFGFHKGNTVAFWSPGD